MIPHGNRIALEGCAPAPLASYLKALGVLRLLSQADPSIRGAWEGEVFVLYSTLGKEPLVEWLLGRYAPTPVVSPWNGGSGFFDKDNKSAITAIAAGAASRLADIRDAIDVAEAALRGLDRSKRPEGPDKENLLLKLRATLPDAALAWLDATVMISGDRLAFPPMLGTGGNDGRLDFSNNFMQRLLDLIEPETGEPTARAGVWIVPALFGGAAPGMVGGGIGQFSPGQVGGPNSIVGFDSEGVINPWDFVLMIEGAMTFAAATARRGATEHGGSLSFPFTVRATAAGAGNLGAADAGASRGELWMPLWSRPATYLEIRSLLAEGRVALGRRPARDALDFTRAVHRLGGYRGVDRFQRYALLQRSGNAFLATPVERVKVSFQPQSEWIDELDDRNWLSRFQKFTRESHVAARFGSLRKRLEDGLFALARAEPRPGELQALLMLLSDIQRAVAASGKAREVVEPIPELSSRWVAAADDGSPLFRLSRALAGLRGTAQHPLPFRAHAFAVHPSRRGWLGAEGSGSSKMPLCLSGRGDVCGQLIEVLMTRLRAVEILGLEDKPLDSLAPVQLGDVGAFLAGGFADRRMFDLATALSLCRVPAEPAGQSPDHRYLGAAWGILKLAVTPEHHLRAMRVLPGPQRMPVPPGMLAGLASGDPAQAKRAIERAWRRLHASGVPPIVLPSSLPGLGGLDPRRVAASLLFPITYGATGALVDSTLQPARVSGLNARSVT
jgi:CRISPR-associated protein Csx17